MASSRERMFTASQVCRLLDEDSDVSSDIEIEVKILNICVGCHDVVTSVFLPARFGLVISRAISVVIIAHAFVNIFQLRHLHYYQGQPARSREEHWPSNQSSLLSNQWVSCQNE